MEIFFKKMMPSTNQHLTRSQFIQFGLNNKKFLEDFKAFVPQI